VIFSEILEKALHRVYITTLKSDVHETLAEINRCWRENRPQEMKPYLHPDITMVFPGFTGSLAGRDAFLGGFTEFCTNARIIEYEESDEQIHVVDRVASVSFRFTIVYERATYRERSDDQWIAVWRTMVDLKEERQTKVLSGRQGPLNYFLR